MTEKRRNPNGKIWTKKQSYDYYFKETFDGSSLSKEFAAKHAKYLTDLYWKKSEIVKPRIKKMATRKKAVKKKKPCKVKSSCRVVKKTTGQLKKGYRYGKGGRILKAKKAKAKPAKRKVKTVKRKVARKPVKRKNVARNKSKIVRRKKPAQYSLFEK